MTATATAIPAELIDRPQWVLWCYVERDGKTTKVPRAAATPWREASSTNPSTWATFERVQGMAHEADGLGFVFTADDDYVGIDLDDCLDEHGELAPWAAEIVEELDSYTERSPSGRGLHILVKGKLPGSRRRSGGFECYDRARYFAITGEVIGERKRIEERQAELVRVVARMLPEPPPAAVSADGKGLPTGDDHELLERAFGASNGAKVEALYRGELNGHASRSEADLALCSALAYWVGPDPTRLDRLYRSSGLMRDKWDSPRGGTTYGAQTIEKALDRRDFYEPRQSPQEEAHRAPGAADDPAAREELAELLGLPDVSLGIVGARIVGRGSRASADLYLSNGEEVTFDSLREFAHPTRLAVEITACTGATPTLKAPMAQKALALLRRISDRRETFTQDQVAIDWGVTYLQSAPVVEVNMRSREDRWRAFSELERHDPYAMAKEQAVSLAHAGRVLRHTDGSRFVRCGWFHSFARTQDVSAGGNADVAARMERVGWQRRGNRGRIKATREGFPGQLQWSFFEVPAGWEDEQ